ncbi:ABC transporter ATP-binding protein [Butyrivibrio sp. YAB3001]|uniref:ABC transporter ATP-binding protein n=1 Tax=Butyrivibrio sp. YAB3001 TaxID=1520812 RepID=UPI0008F678B4|nr:ABC transporter ATP-binding protein [Butyrivibrio sp. YAB3001]SFC74298.1 ABC-type bacteriocin/lantibiotic exporter, contains an N-terminal double-glycine peptidase domain [Butyrivibrio sp. YAB3001]
MKKNILLFKEILDEIFYILDKKQKLQMLYVLFTIILSSAFELLGVTAILPFVQAIVSPENLMSNVYVKRVCKMIGINDYTSLLIFIGVGLIIVYISKNTFLIYANFVQTDFLTSMQKNLSIRMLDSYLSRPYSFFLDTSSETMRVGCLSSIVSFRDTIGDLLKLMTEVLTAVLIGVYLIYTDWFTALGTLAVLGIILIVMVFAFKPAVKKAGNYAKMADVERNQSISQAVEGIKDIIVAKRKAYFVKAFENAAEKARIGARTYTVLGDCPNRVTEGVCVSGIIGIVCIRLAIGDESMASFVPKLASFAMAAFKVLPSVGKIANVINSIVYNRPLEAEVFKNVHEVEKYNSVKEQIKELDYDESVSVYNKILADDFNICLENVEWRYSSQGKEILKGLSLEIKKGQSVGFIGASGAGKTTLVDIILGLFKPQAGEVTIDGVDIFSIPEVWSKLVGYVPQSIYLIDNTIRANIAFGMQEADDERVWKALEKANLKSFVESLPEKLDTLVGERGVKFSGGQRQRVAIARALYNEPEILVLDEATAALDNDSENVVMESIEELQGDVTLLIVAHRLTTIRNCDKIFEITNGVAIEKSKEDVL